MSERACVRVGCRSFEVHPDGTREPRHYSACPSYKNPANTSCSGCVPGECRDGSLVCDSCFGKARALLDDTPDILGRLRALGDPAKSGWNWDREVIGGSAPVVAPAPIGDDLLDAIHGVQTAMSYFAAGIEALSNDREAMGWLGPLVLDQHPPLPDGTRVAWSVRDARDRWGVESRHKHAFPIDTLDDGVLDRVPVTGWWDPLRTVAEAAELRGVSERSTRKWVEKGLVPVAVRHPGARGSILTLAHESSWYSVKPCPIVHRGAWCTRVGGHDGVCVTRPGERPAVREIETKEDGL